jgi:hypothetical protein
MSGKDLRGFDYALEPARQRAHHRVDAAIGAIGQCQRALTLARQQAQALRDQCREVARHSTPAQRALIDPWRAMAASRQWLQLREALALAEQTEQDHEAALEKAKSQLNQARVEQETFDTHRDEALADHGRDLARRQQSLADQEWLARPGAAPAANVHPEVRREA